MTHRVAFYPCCSTDVAGPLELLRDFADEVVFCDVNPSLPRLWKDIAARIAEGSPKASFLSEDVRTAVDGIERIDVFFYRHDSDGEGGSGVFVLGNSFLPALLRRFPAHGGYIITDGSNSRGSNFKRMIRSSGLTKHGWHFHKAAEQPFLAAHGLYVVSVQVQESQSRG
jgi:hypothetical protein